MVTIIVLIILAGVSISMLVGMIACFTYTPSWNQESFEKGMWIAEYNKNKILYEKFGTVNFDGNIPSNFDTNKIFYDTYYNTSGGILSCVNEYNFTLLELEERQLMKQEVLHGLIWKECICQDQEMEVNQKE